MRAQTSSSTATTSTREQLYIPQGSLLTEAMNDGPACYAGTNNINLIGAVGADLTVQLNQEVAGRIDPPTGPGGSNTYLQDTRDWFAVHGGGARVRPELRRVHHSRRGVKTGRPDLGNGDGPSRRGGAPGGQIDPAAADHAARLPPAGVVELKVIFAVVPRQSL